MRVINEMGGVRWYLQGQNTELSVINPEHSSSVKYRCKAVHIHKGVYYDPLYIREMIMARWNAKIKTLNIDSILYPKNYLLEEKTLFELLNSKVSGWECMMN